MDYWLTIRHRCIDMLSWTEILTVSFHPRAKIVWIPLRMSTEICRLGEGHNWRPLECRLSVGKPFPRRPRKCCRLETIACWLCHLKLQCTCFSNQNVPWRNKVLKPNICICHFHFCEWKNSGWLLQAPCNHSAQARHLTFASNLTITL